MLHACRSLLRLCLLELQEGVRHDQVADERIQMAFSQSATDSSCLREKAVSMSFERDKNCQSSASRDRASLADRSDATNSVVRDLGRMYLDTASSVRSGP